MTNQPRRAASPLSPEDAEDDVPTGRYARATWAPVSDDDNDYDDEDDELTATGTRFFRLDDAETPVPPPAPVLPVSGPTLPLPPGYEAPSARRSSTSPVTAITRYSPRFSATTAGSPLSPTDDRDATKPRYRSTEPPTNKITAVEPPTTKIASVEPPTRKIATVEAPAAPLSGAGSSGSTGLPGQAPSGDSIVTPHPRTAAEPALPPLHVDESPAKVRGAMPTRSRVILASVAGLLALVLIGLGIYAGTRPTAAPVVTPGSAAASLAATQLISAAEAGTLKAGTTWDEAAESATAQPRCLSRPDTTASPSASATSSPSAGPTTTFQRLLQAAGGGDAVLQRVEVYPTALDASNAFTTRVAQLGACSRTQAYINSGATIDGLADSAVAVTVTLQEAVPEFHTIVLTRNGTAITIADAAQTSSPIGVQELVGAIAPSLTRVCQTTAGCPTTPAVTPTPPPAAAPSGWLVENDLPRITPGAGTWKGTDPTSELNLPGSLCENVDLANPPAVTGRSARTYLMSNDANAPSGFGLDEARYTFATEADATNLANTLTSNIGSCNARTATATVTAQPGAQATGAGGAVFNYATAMVTQKIDDTRSVIYRIGVVNIGTKVVYLLANPSATFDFGDDLWRATVIRAGERLTQQA